MVKLLLALTVVVLVVAGFVWHDAHATSTEPSAFAPQNSAAMPAVLKGPAPLVIPAAAPLRAKSISRNLPGSGTWRGKPAVADLNGDGRPDIVASIRRVTHEKPGEGLFVWLNDGNGGWVQAVNGMRRDLGYGGAEVGDVNGDGRPDIAFSGHDGLPQIYVNYLNVEPASWVSTTERGLGQNSPCADVALGDFNRDGKCDLAVIGQFPHGAGLQLYYGDGSGGMHDPVQLMPELIFGQQVRMRDLDGDGYVELLATTALGPKVWWFDAEHGPVEHSTGLPVPKVGGADVGLDVADLDGDGTLELMVSGGDYPAGKDYEAHPPLAIYRYSEGTWHDWGRGLPTGESFLDAKFGHIDDGPPVIFAGGKFGISVIRMTSPGVFERSGRLEGNEETWNLGVGDVDGDGYDEVIVVGIGGVRVLSLKL